MIISSARTEHIGLTPPKLAEAHEQCQMDFLSYIQYGPSLRDENFAIVVDNTNLSLAEYGYYASWPKQTVTKFRFSLS